MSKNILICPLNWGIGHATRCIPIIKLLQSRNHNVFVASDGEALKLLKSEFPNVEGFELPSYSVTYPTNNILINVGIRIPKIISTVFSEKKRIAQIVNDKKIDIIISDNRFGCRNKSCTNIFVTHQVNLITPGTFIENIVRKFNMYEIQKFDHCWIPDFEEFPGLSGILGHQHKLNASYIGPLSRMQRLDIDLVYDYAIVLSGPEPQRTNLEKELVQKLQHATHKIAFVGGNFTNHQPEIQNKNITYFKLLDSAKLNEVFCSSGFIVCRSGYSTIMDIAVLGKKAMIIPTPGQTEQEYLAEIYEQSKWFLRQLQGKVKIEDNIHKLSDYSGIDLPNRNELLIEAMASHGL